MNICMHCYLDCTLHGVYSMSYVMENVVVVNILHSMRNYINIIGEYGLWDVDALGAGRYTIFTVNSNVNCKNNKVN